jgi:hypothetical protein
MSRLLLLEKGCGGFTHRGKNWEVLLNALFNLPSMHLSLARVFLFKILMGR